MTGPATDIHSLMMLLKRLQIGLTPIHESSAFQMFIFYVYMLLFMFLLFFGTRTCTSILLLLLCSSEHCKSSLTCSAPPSFFILSHCPVPVLYIFQSQLIVEVSNLLCNHNLSNAILKLSTLVLHTISSGRLFHSFMHLIGKEFSLNDFLTCCFSKRNKCPRVLLSLKVKNLLTSMLSNPLIILKI